MRRSTRNLSGTKSQSFDTLQTSILNVGDAAILPANTIIGGDMHVPAVHHGIELVPKAGGGHDRRLDGSSTLGEDHDDTVILNGRIEGFGNIIRMDDNVNIDGANHATTIEGTLSVGGTAVFSGETTIKNKLILHDQHDGEGGFVTVGCLNSGGIDPVGGATPAGYGHFPSTVGTTDLYFGNHTSRWWQRCFFKLSGLMYIGSTGVFLHNAPGSSVIGGLTIQSSDAAYPKCFEVTGGTGNASIAGTLSVGGTTTCELLFCGPGGSVNVFNQLALVPSQITNSMNAVQQALQTQITFLQAQFASLQSDHTALEARVAALEV